jgi:hypothetical protein
MFHDDRAFFRETLRAVNHIADGGADLGKAVSTAFRINEKDLGSSHRDRTAIANQLRPVADNAGSAGHVKSATGDAGTGRRLGTAQARPGDAVPPRFALAADVTRRGRIDAPAGAWTPARLSGLELSGLTSGATVTLLSREMV